MVVTRRIKCIDSLQRHGPTLTHPTNVPDVLISPWPRQLEAHQAFELAFGLAAGMRIDLGLALLSQIAGGKLGERAALDRLLAALLDEGSEHRRLAILGRQVGAIPVLAAVAGVEEVAQQICLLAVA